MPSEILYPHWRYKLNNGTNFNNKPRYTGTHRAAVIAFVLIELLEWLSGLAMGGSLLLELMCHSLGLPWKSVHLSARSLYCSHILWNLFVSFVKPFWYSSKNIPMNQTLNIALKLFNCVCSKRWKKRNIYLWSRKKPYFNYQWRNYSCLRVM